MEQPAVNMSTAVLWTFLLLGEVPVLKFDDFGLERDSREHLSRTSLTVFTYCNERASFLQMPLRL
jgi:hypothetical protein